MKQLNKEELKNLVIVIAVIAVVIAVVTTAVKYLWPVLLVLAVYYGWKWYRRKKEMEALEQEVFSMADLQERLFQSQVKRKQNSADIIDAEFTESDKGERR